MFRIRDDNLKLGASSGRQMLISTLATTDASDGYIESFSTTSNLIYYVRAELTARRTGGGAGSANDSAVYVREARAKNNNGTLTIEDLTDTLTSEDQAGWDATIRAVGTNIVVQVNGAASNNINWTSTTTLQSIT